MINRNIYYSEISRLLTNLITEIKTRGKGNLHDYNLYAEDFFKFYFSILFGCNLKNANEVNQNASGIDLIDPINKIVVQVSSICNTTKVQHSLDMIIGGYQNYHFYFIALNNDVGNARKHSYVVPQGITFNPIDDIYDLGLILRKTQGAEISILRRLYELTINELNPQGSVDNTMSFQPLNSDIAKVISILSEIWPTQKSKNITKKACDLNEKIEFNNLLAKRPFIRKYIAYQEAIDRIYSTLSHQSENLIEIVLSKINDIYIERSVTFSDVLLFDKIIDDLEEHIKKSANFDASISSENLRTCVNIVAIDAFFRCEIFENPENYKSEC